MLVVARWTVLEARRRRLLLAGVVLSVAFVALFVVGFALLYHSQERSLLQAQGIAPPGGFDARGELVGSFVQEPSSGLHLVEQLADHPAVPHDLGGLLDQVTEGRGLGGRRDGRAVGTNDLGRLLSHCLSLSSVPPCRRWGT